MNRPSNLTPFTLARALTAAAGIVTLSTAAAAPTVQSPSISPTQPITRQPAVSLAKPLPDLEVVSVKLDPACRVVVTVRNNGPGVLPDAVWTTRAPNSSSVYLSIDGKNWGGATLASFDPGRRLRAAGGTAEYASGYSVTTSATVRATVDHTAQVAEVSEGNNAQAAKLVCAGVQTKKPPKPTTPRISGTQEQAESIPYEYGGDVPSDFGGYAPAPAPRAGGGSLLDRQLPPSPQDLPVMVRDDASHEPAELIVVSDDIDAALQLAQSAQGLGLGVKRRSRLAGLGFVVTVLRVPPGAQVVQSLAQLRESLPNVWADANHRYTLQGDTSTTSYAPALIGWNAGTGCGKGVRVGIIDSAIDVTHPSLAGAHITQRSFLPTGIRPAPLDHGTAATALLVGNSSHRVQGLLPGAHVYAASVFRAIDDDRIDTTAEWIVAALNWLVENEVTIVNVSLGGPRNLLLEAAVGRALARGTVLVAAAGNGGPDAAPVFPAAQDGVIAVTAVDVRLDPYRAANRGDYISFAAPGVDVWTAMPGKGAAHVSGTSYATPFLVAAFAATRQAHPKLDWPAVHARLQQKARDLGASGRDPVFGWGLVQVPVVCTARAR